MRMKLLQIVDIQLGENAISILIHGSDGFRKVQNSQGHYIYSFAESLAIAVIDAEVALVGVANIKYKTGLCRLTFAGKSGSQAGKTQESYSLGTYIS